MTLRACDVQADQVLHRSGPSDPDHVRGLSRPLAVYLAVVELEIPASQVRRVLGWTRDDVDSACLDVEELREDRGLDEAVAAAGAALRACAAPTSAPQRPPAPPKTVTDLNAARRARAVRRALGLLVAAGGAVVTHDAFGTAQTARTAICAARKAVGKGAIRTVRGRGFRLTEAGLKALRDRKIGGFGENADSPDAPHQPNQFFQRSAA